MPGQGLSGFTGNAQTVSVTQSGDYYLTITDAGCLSASNGFVYSQFIPAPRLCRTTGLRKGQTVQLSASGTSAATGGASNAGNATAKP